jgi:hypothetical protein
MVRWHSLFLSPDNAVDVPSTLLPILEAEGYTPYDPFTLGGRAYPDAVRLFIAPRRQWQRLLLEVTQPEIADGIAAALSQDGICISAWLEKANGDVHIFQAGQSVADSVLAPYQTDNPQSHTSEDEGPKVGSIPVADMPESIQAMAGKVKPKHAEKLFNKMTKSIFGGSEANAARDLLDDAPDWSSDAGQHISRTLTSLGITNWREPDFATLRGAYALHHRLKRNPNATLLPGDDAILKAVPNALDYIPFYMGRTT